MTTDSFAAFCELCKLLAAEPSYNNKTSIIKKFISNKSVKGRYGGNLVLLAKLLLPGVEKRIYNLKDKQILKHTSQIFQTPLHEMTGHLEDKGIVSNTVRRFFKKSTTIKPLNESVLNLQQVDAYLEELSKVTKDEAQISTLSKICRKCTTEDLSFIVKLIKHDLRMNTGPKHFFDALDKNAYAAYQASSDIKGVVEQWLSDSQTGTSSKGSMSVKASLMTPMKPMLAEACKSIEQAFKKCPNGLYSEIKYDGERVQIHKQGSKFEYFSRSLKPVTAHKIANIKDYLPKACPGGDSLILDGEVLLMDSKTNKPLPFGTLGIHKKSKFTDATVCYVIFDILQLNNDNLLNRPLSERRSILLKNVEEIKGRIIHSEMKHVTKKEQLQDQLKKVFADNLEGLVIKDAKSKYEPGKRHWLKIKKDYLGDGALADSADLVVLGAYLGTGNKGGMMSVFLMGCYDNASKQWKTVAKCGNGHDDNTLNKLQTTLNMKKITKDPANVPSWLDVNRSLIPDYVTQDPKSSPVWEITGAEYSHSTTHTAAGISIRFPRVTRIRHDKDWTTATNLTQLQALFKESKVTTDIDIDAETKDADESTTSVTKKRKIADGDESSSPVKKKKDDDKEKMVQEVQAKKEKVCEFGSNCYRKNKQHFVEYDHSGESTEEAKKHKLEDIFTGMKFFVCDDIDVAEAKKLRRYLVAYNGDVLEDFEQATHFISKKSTCGQGKVVTPKWVWKCVNNKTCC